MQFKYAPVLLTAMFFFSGLNKLTNFSNSVSSFETKFNLGQIVSKFIILCVICLEILAPVIIFYYYYYDKTISNYAKYSIFALIVFTTLTTILYHPLYITNYYKSIPFLANVSLIGGLLLLLEKF